MSDIFDLDYNNSETTYDNISALMPTFPWIDELNPEQKKAVLTTNGPLLVLSGAGTGKTKVLTTRLAYILANHLTNPWNCLVVTFTNRAAKEMTQRARNMIGNMVDSVWMGTFHGICAKILRRHAELVGLQNNFTILGDDDQRRIIKQICEAKGIDDKKYPPAALLDKIQLWKDKGRSVDKLNENFQDNVLTTVYKQYQARLLELNCVDFGDILLYTLNILMSSPDILSQYQERFQYIMVDEYQDTNVTQYLLLRLLCQKHRNICCVGDDDQSIYSWRGAEIENILRFEKDFDDAQIIRLERNYRSTANILSAASGLISHNHDRLGKELKVAENSPANRDENRPIKVVSTYSGSDEANYIAEEIENLHRKYQTAYSDMAILVRTAAQTREFEEKFMAEAIPYQVIGGPRFYERAEIRDIIAYLRVIAQPHDDLALERIINKPTRGIGAKAVEKIQVTARQQGISMYMAVEFLINSAEFSGKTKANIIKLFDNFKIWRQNAQAVTPDETVSQVIEDSGYMEMLQNDTSAEAEGRIENIKELISVLGDHEKYPDLGTFLEHVSLVTENDNESESNKVTLITLHSAKGLEFDTVFLPGWEDGLFPHQKALDCAISSALEEERRLAYVAITRARRRLYISMAMNRRVYGQWQNNLPSRFINELPPRNLEIINQASNYFGDNHYQNNRYKSNDNKDNLNYNHNSVIRDSERFSYVRDDYRPSYSASKNEYPVGTKVYHETFGYGKVLNCDGNKLEIWFDKYGHKKLMKDYIRKA